MTKKHVTTEMKWIDWTYLKRLASLVKEVVEAVYNHCQEMDLIDIMSFSCNWNEEVVAQFSTLFGHTGSSIHYGGGYIVEPGSSKVDLHKGNELEPSKMHFMYDRAYGDYSLWTGQGTHSLL